MDRHLVTRHVSALERRIDVFLFDIDHEGVGQGEGSGAVGYDRYLHGTNSVAIDARSLLSGDGRCCVGRRVNPEPDQSGPRNPPSEHTSTREVGHGVSPGTLHVCSCRQRPVEYHRAPYRIQCLAARATPLCSATMRFPIEAFPRCPGAFSMRMFLMAGAWQTNDLTLQ